MPTPAYLQTCKKAAVFFTNDMQFRQSLNVPKLEDWRIRVQTAADEKNWPMGKTDQLIDLMSKLLCYENRATADALLRRLYPFTYRLQPS